jgi:zinc transport system substrate-binding protein
MIQSMVELLTGGELEVRLLIPPSACPGHFDLKPADAVGLSKASLIIRHDYQDYLDRKLVSQNPGLEIAVLETPGHFVIPANYLKALVRVREILGERLSDLSPVLDENFALSSQRLEQAEQDALERIDETELSGAKALCSVRQADFLRWLGVEVVGTFPNSPEELSLLQLKQLVSSARANQVSFVAGNLQGGGPTVARGVADELGIPLCILSNFPGSNKRNATYFDLLQDNIDLLLRTLLDIKHP